MSILRIGVFCLALMGSTTSSTLLASGLQQPSAAEQSCWTRYGKFTTKCAADDVIAKLRGLGFLTRVTLSDCGCYYLVDYKH
ncbi:MAG: hypothetical protein AAF483_01660 [Planctomycetota bacterium]